MEGKVEISYYFLTSFRSNFLSRVSWECKRDVKTRNWQFSLRNYVFYPLVLYCWGTMTSYCSIARDAEYWDYQNRWGSHKLFATTQYLAITSPTLGTSLKNTWAPTLRYHLWPKKVAPPLSPYQLTLPPPDITIVTDVSMTNSPTIFRYLMKPPGFLRQILSIKRMTNIYPRSKFGFQNSILQK